MVRREHIPAKLRHEVFKRDHYRCRECGATNKETTLEIDHIVPVSKGGTNNINNLQTLCKTCNRAKHTRTWVGGEYNNQNSITSDYQSINSELYELNRKQREINSRKYRGNKYAHITRQELYKLNRNQREINSRIYNKKKYENSTIKQGKKKYENNTRKQGKKKDKSIKIIVNPKNNLNDKLNKVIDEFKRCNDINIVSQETGILSSDIKKWYKIGKKGNLVYKEFYEELSKLPPNMSIKKSKIKKNNNTKSKSVKVSSSYTMLYKKCSKCGEEIDTINMSICPECGADFNNKSDEIKNIRRGNLPKNNYQSQNKKISLKLCPKCKNKINKILDECPYCKYNFNPNNKKLRYRHNICPNCNTLNISDGKKCNKCGADLKPKLYYPYNGKSKNRFQKPTSDIQKEIINKFIKGYSIKRVSRLFNISTNVIYDWYFKGKNSNCEHTEFYNNINNLVPDIANKIEENNKKRLPEGKFYQLIEENLDDLCRIYSIPKLGKIYVANRIVKEHTFEEVVKKLEMYK